MRYVLSRNGLFVVTLSSALIALFFLAFSASAAGPWFVSPAGNDANDCLSSGTACLTIQAAIDKATAGDTVNVAAGTYAENVNVNKTVTLLGANAGTPGNGARVAESIVDGGGVSAAFALNANDVVINGFTIKGGQNSLNAGIWSGDASGYDIINNIITDNTIGVWADCTGNCLIQENLFDANNRTGSSEGAGISADNTNGMTIDDNEFENHTVGNPILFQAVAPGAHLNVSVTDNDFYDNAFTNIYALAITGGTFTGNTISPASDATGISFSGANQNIDVNHNVITGGIRGVRIEDAGYYGANGGNSNIVVNRNSVANNSQYGIGVLSGYTGDINGTCNWWGAANGPGPVGPGTGSPVTAGVDFDPFLASADLDGQCPALAETVTVMIVKYIDEAPATAENADNAAFPMHAIFPGGEGDYDLDADGFNNPNPYQATTAEMPEGSDYSTYEITTGNVVGDSCAEDDTPFVLVGYSTGTSLEDAADEEPQDIDAAEFENLQDDMFVIVWNETCDDVDPSPSPSPSPILTLQKTVVGGTAEDIDWELHADGPQDIVGEEGESTITNASVQVGTYTLSESDGPTGYTASAWVCTDDNDENEPFPVTGGNSITLAAGDDVTCVITNTFEDDDTHTVTIYKYIDGQPATTGGPFTIDPSVGDNFELNTGNSYEVAVQVDEDTDYSLKELLNSIVGNSCRDGKPYDLVGYTVGNTESSAANRNPSSSVKINDISRDKAIIVWNKTCQTSQCNRALINELKSDIEELKDDYKDEWRDLIRQLTRRNLSWSQRTEILSDLRELKEEYEAEVETLEDQLKAEERKCKKKSWGGWWNKNR